MKKLFLPLFFVALFSGCAATPENLSSDANDKTEEMKKICETKRVIGSRIPEKFCYTKKEFETMEEADREAFEKAQRTGERRRIQETLGRSNNPQ